MPQRPLKSMFFERVPEGDPGRVKKKFFKKHWFHPNTYLKLDVFRILAHYAMHKHFVVNPFDQNAFFYLSNLSLFDLTNFLSKILELLSKYSSTFFALKKKNKKQTKYTV